MMQMDNEKIMSMLLELLQKTAVIESKLNMIEELKINEKVLSDKIDRLENQNAEHDRVIKSLERRANVMEEWNREKMNDSRKQQTSVFISLGMAVFSALLSFVFAMFK
jgi:septal ring factor EnvC (AmiA/AmiB activator)